MLETLISGVGLVAGILVFLVVCIVLAIIFACIAGLGLFFLIALGIVPVTAGGLGAMVWKTRGSRNHIAQTKAETARLKAEATLEKERRRAHAVTGA